MAMDRNFSKFIAVAVFCSLLILLASAPAARADIYRYIDENGVMHFTNTPTNSSRHYQVFIKERPRQSTLRCSARKYDRVIADASRRYGVSAPLIKAIIKAESDFDPQAVSKKGAMGLMQIMPQNFKLLGLKDPFNPVENIHAGARYFKQLYDRFKGRLALSLAAYNAGPSVVDRYKTIPPFEETEQYVQRVLKYYYNFKNL